MNLPALDNYQVAKIVTQLYSDHPDTYRFWNGGILAVDGGYTGIRREGDIDIIVPRGSTTRYDWYLDFDALPTIDPDLGDVHCGFSHSVQAAWDWATARLSKSRQIISPVTAKALA